jgi:hypothetical protein
MSKLRPNKCDQSGHNAISWTAVKVSRRGGQLISVGNGNFSRLPMKSEAKPVKPLNLNKLRKDLQLIMDEIDRTQGVLPDYYSPVMWTRLQETAERVANAIQAVRMNLSGNSVGEIAKELGLSIQSVAAYLAWNTMYDPSWIKPLDAVGHTACPSCGAPIGTTCSGIVGNAHGSRIEAFRKSSDGEKYLQSKAHHMEERYGIKAVAAS